MEMATQRDSTDELQARLDTIVKEFNAAKKHRLVDRAIALWNDAEADWAITNGQPAPPKQKN